MNRLIKVKYYKGTLASKEGIRSFYLFFLLTLFSTLSSSGHVYEFNAKNTITVVELDESDEVRYKLQTGRIVHLKIVRSRSEIVFSTIDLPAKGSPTDASVFKMKCLVNIDGHDLNLTRFAPVQESFDEPYYINGLIIWFDALKSLNQFYNENHGDCLPNKQVRIALHDATLPICPEEITYWSIIPDNLYLFSLFTGNRVNFKNRTSYL